MELPNGMLPGGQPAAPNHTMQRPQQGNWVQQLNAKILENIRSTLSQFQGGWQAMFDIRERASLIMQLVTMLRAIQPVQTVQSVLQIALTFELHTLRESQTKEAYHESMKKKLADITMKRKQTAIQMGNLANNMSQINQMNMGNGMMNLQNMQNNGMGNMGFANGGGMGMQPGQMNTNAGSNPMFPAQLQRPMQPSPLNMPQQPQQPATLDPSALQLPPQQHRPNSQQSGPAPGQGNQNQGNNFGQGGQTGQPPMNQQELMAHTKRMYDNMSEEQKNTIRQKLFTSLTEQQREQLKGDPVFRWCAQRVATQFRNQQQQRMSMNASSNQLEKTGPQSGEGSNMAMNNNMSTRSSSQTGGPNIDFTGLLGQQAATARKLQQSGEQVVPASNNNNNNNNNNNTGNNNNNNNNSNTQGLGIGSQMDMPQNVNPSLLGQNGNNMNQNHLNFFMMQKDAQQRERLQKQMMAQQHAMQSRNQLQGQPGGLHTPNNFNGGANGPANSPAMSMLNRPIATPSTPQPNRTQPAPSTPMNNASQLMQHHQQMVNHNNQQQMSQQMNPGVTNNPQLASILDRVPAQFRSKLAQLSPEKVQQFLAQFKSMPGRPSGQPPGVPNMNMGGQMPGNMQGQNLAPPQMSNAMPGFNTQPQPNQMPTDAAIIQQRQAHARIRAQAMDMMPFPKPVLTQLGVAVPPNVQVWGQLKQHVMQNAPPNTVAKLQEHQSAWFNARPAELQSAMQMVMNQQRRMQQNAQAGQQQQQPPQPQPQHNAAPPPAPMTAPPAQMVPPAPMMQTPGQGLAQGGMNQGPQRLPQIPPPTPQEIQMFRRKIPQATNMTDENIRGVLMKQKIDRFRAAFARQQNGQLQASTAQAGVTAPSVVPNATQAAQRTPQTAPSQPATGPQAGASKGQQQQARDDVIEISDPNAQQAPSQAPAMQPSLSQGQKVLQPLSQEQMNKLTDAQKHSYLQNMKKHQMESMRKAAQGAQPGAGPSLSVRATPNLEKIQSMIQEVAKQNPKGKAVQIDAAGMEKAEGILKKLWKPLKQLATTYAVAFAYGVPEPRIKAVMRAKEIVGQNAADETGTIQNFLSVNVQQLEDIERTVAGYMMALRSAKSIYENAQRGGTAQSTSQGGTTSTTTQSLPQQAPGMAQTTSQQGHVRKASATAKAPPAPTDNKTFDWGPSPHGVPKYDLGRKELTPDKLKIPAPKKRKTDQPSSQASTPAAHVGTPAAVAASPALTNGKLQSPDQTRKAQVQAKLDAEREAEQKKFRCRDVTCEASLRGFETEAQLKQHERDEHQPVEDVLGFLLGNAANVLGVDKDGKPLSSVAALQPAKDPSNVSAKKRTATVRDLKKEDLTKHEMEQLSRNITPPSVKEKIAKKQTEMDAALRTSGKELNLREAIAQKLDIPLPDERTPQPAADERVYGCGEIALLAPLEKDPLELFDFDMGEGWVCTDLERGIWELRPEAQDFDSSPDLTPAGSDSSQLSDVSQTDEMKFLISMENLDADMFEDGSGGGVPASMIPLYHQIKEMQMENVDASMEGTDEKETSKKRKADQQWTQPVADFFEDFFGGSVQ